MKKVQIRDIYNNFALPQVVGQSSITQRKNFVLKISMISTEIKKTFNIVYVTPLIISIWKIYSQGHNIIVNYGQGPKVFDKIYPQYFKILLSNRYRNLISYIPRFNYLSLTMATFTLRASALSLIRVKKDIPTKDTIRAMSTAKTWMFSKSFSPKLSNTLL